MDQGGRGVGERAACHHQFLAKEREPKKAETSVGYFLLWFPTFRQCTSLDPSQQSMNIYMSLKFCFCRANYRSKLRVVGTIIVTFRRKFASCEKPIFFRPKAQKSREFRRNSFALLWNNTVYSMVGLLTL